MRLTKDEARILAEAMKIAKYEMLTLSYSIYDQLTDLEEKLYEFGKDKRRTGRTSMDDWNDMMKRFVEKSKNANN
ncbi:MAG: hypothetical protein LAT57_00180 [Balneolales bacterium]|nr:hypothetical protein [Balneolales bacterium]